MKTYQTKKMGWLTWAKSVKVGELENFRPASRGASFKGGKSHEDLEDLVTSLGADPRHAGS